MHFGFALDLSDIDLLNIDLLDQRYTHLDLLDTDIPSKHFICFQDVLKASSRHALKKSSRYVFKMSSRHVFKTSSRHVFKKSSRRFQRNNFSSSKTSSRGLARCIQDVLEDEKLLRWRSVEDIFKTCLKDVFKTSWRPINVCWVRSTPPWPPMSRNLYHFSINAIKSCWALYLFLHLHWCFENIWLRYGYIWFYLNRS